MAQLGLVVRADGTVPFDADLHPAYKAGMLKALAEAGHTVTVQTDGSHRIENFNAETFQQSFLEK